MIQSWKECSMLVLRHIQTREWKSSSVCCPNTRRCCQRSPIARKPAGSVQWILCNSSRWLRQVTVYYHLKQNLVAKKDITAVLSNAYRLGEKLMVDFASDNLSYVDPDTGEIINIGAFVACMPYSGYTYVICVPLQKTEDFLYAIRMCLEHLGGVSPILTPDNLKSTVISNDRHEPELNKALDYMENYYHFVVLPCNPASPIQKALIEDSVRITYSRIYARLCNHTFHSFME